MSALHGMRSCWVEIACIRSYLVNLQISVALVGMALCPCWTMLGTFVAPSGTPVAWLSHGQLFIRVTYALNKAGGYIYQPLLALP